MVGRIFRKMAKDWFLAGMIAAVALATLFPGFGATGGAMHAETVSDMGIFAVFLLHGLALSTQSLKQGMSRWKLHLLVQSLTFVAFPLLFIPFRAAFGGIIPEGLMLGFLYLCALPSTIQSSVAMTAIGKGNVPAAIFNATLSSLLGIALTPAIVGLVIDMEGAGGMSFGKSVVNIATMLFLPFVLGQVLRPVFGNLAARHKKCINAFDKLVILMLVYGSFCDSVKSGLWTNNGIEVIALTMGGAAVFLAMALFISSKVSKWLGFSMEDRITAIFCGSKKTLASGVPMARLLFGAHPALGMIVMPIMFYHQLQLFVCSIMAGRFADRFKAAESPMARPEASPAEMGEPALAVARARN
ncbi:MAG: bile acid:sodium symporter family protein [Solidesulfovibrio sp. DCME]|uniref:bile acid:sodium symporter family protein n=1 Tax=Solidesulfovibrio sp. DCME TaxID=3447380 RepID=UPI003D0A45AE